MTCKCEGTFNPCTKCKRTALVESMASNMLRRMTDEVAWAGELVDDEKSFADDVLSAMCRKWEEE